MSDSQLGRENLVQHAGWLRGLARQLIADADEAEDAAQDTLVIALTRPPTFVTNVKGWLAKVLRNEVNASRRGALRRVVRERESIRAAELPSPDVLVDRLAEHRAVVEEVELLPEPCRAAILLRYFEDRSLKEIARHTGVPVSTVNTRLRRGLALLRQRLDRRYGDRAAWVAALVPLAGVRSWFATASVSFVGIAVLAMAGLYATFLLFFGMPDPTSVRSTSTTGVPGSSTSSEPSAGLLEMKRSPVDEFAANGVLVKGELAIAGQVLDVQGRGVAGVEVGFFRTEAGDRFPRIAAPLPRGVASPLVRGRSDAAGGFTMRVPGEDGRLRVVEPGWKTVLAGVSFVGMVEARVLVAAPLQTVSGHVHDLSGAPIPASVQFHLPEGFRARFDRPLDAAVDEEFLAQVGADGRFRMAVPRVEGAELSLRCSGYEPERVALPSRNEPLSIVLQPLTESWESSLCLRFVDGAGEPLPEVRVAIARRDVVRTDAAGRVRVPISVIDSETELVAVRQGYQSLPIDPRRCRAGLERVLVMDQPAKALSGTVQDVWGNPLRGAWVWVSDPEVFAALPGRTLVVESEVAGAATNWNVVVTDARGRFRIDGLSDRDYALRVSRPGSSRFGVRAPVSAGAMNVELRYPTDAVVGIVTGRVVDSTGAAVASALISATRYALQLETPGGRKSGWFANGPSVRTAADGSFVLREVPEGVELTVSGAGLYQTGFAASTWGEGAAVELSVPRSCHLQVSASAERTGLSFGLEDATRRPLAMQMHLGIGSLPHRRCPLHTGRSAVVAIPDLARTVVLYDGDREVGRRSIDLQTEGVNRVRF